MNKEKVAKILDAMLDDAEEKAAAILPRFSEDSIHAFRVAVKKLRAYTRLINAAGDRPQLKLTKKFHRLYEIAGEIRDAQLKLKRVKQYKTQLPDYIKTISSGLANGKKQWKAHYDKAVFKELKKELEGRSLRRLTAKVLVDFCKQHIQVLEDAADTIPGDELIHECRKSVKDIMYNTRLAEKSWRRAYSKVSHLPLIILDRLSDLLGDFNDERILLDSHLLYMAQLKNKKVQAKLKQLSDAECRSKEEQKQALLKELKRFVTAVTI